MHIIGLSPLLPPETESSRQRTLAGPAEPQPSDTDSVPTPSPVLKRRRLSPSALVGDRTSGHTSLDVGLREAFQRIENLEVGPAIEFLERDC